MSETVLYHGRASTCSKKVRIALFEKGAPFESHLLDLQKFEQHSPEFLKINPKGLVPALVHRGDVILESSIIIEYVDEAFAGPRLSPPTAAGRARMRTWLRFSDEVAYDAVYAPTWQFMRHRAEQGLSPENIEATLACVPTAERKDRWAQMSKGGYSEADLAASVAKMENCLDALEKQLTKSTWLLGESFSLADVAVIPFADRINNLRPELLHYANRKAVLGWLENARKRPAVTRALEFTEDQRALELPNI